MRYVIAILLVCTACAPKLVKTGATPDEFKVDDYQCRAQWRQNVYLEGIIPVHHTDKAMYYRCMELKGWVPEK